MARWTFKIAPHFNYILDGGNPLRPTMSETRGGVSKLIFLEAPLRFVPKPLSMKVSCRFHKLTHFQLAALWLGLGFVWTDFRC